MQRSEIVDPFFRALYDRLMPEIEEKMAGLANGSAKINQNDAGTVAEKYLEQVAHIAALRKVLTVCEEIHGDMYGAKREEE